jgi:hypothetical protein
MHTSSYRNQAIAFLLGLSILAFSPASWADDPPTRVARLGYISGQVSFAPAGDDTWISAPLNRPVIAGDRLWTDGGARNELQVGANTIRMAGNTSVAILSLDDRTAQLQLSQGRLNLHVPRLNQDEVLEVDTPNLAFVVRRPGDYRIDVDPAGNSTSISVRNGQGEAFGESAAYTIDSGQTYRFTGTGLRDYQYMDSQRSDDFDRWAMERDRRLENSASARYIPREIVGYGDLDDYGTWRTVQGYGSVWMPTRVARGWVPYREGHWEWIRPWGWTWVDDAPWGFAVTHYGRWTHINGAWGWVPGPRAARPVYAPALVAFTGGSFRLNARNNGEGVAWFPLAPREIYRPSYQASRNYFTEVNTANTIVNRTHITNVYNNVNVTNITYANRRVPGAVIAVPAHVFANSQPVAKAVVPVPTEIIARVPVPAIAIAPVRSDLSTGFAASGHRPPPEILTRQIMAKTPPHIARFTERNDLPPRQPLATQTPVKILQSPATPAPIAKTQPHAPAISPSQTLMPSVPEHRTSHGPATQTRIEPVVTPTPQAVHSNVAPPPRVPSTPQTILTLPPVQQPVDAQHHADRIIEKRHIPPQPAGLEPHVPTIKPSTPIQHQPVKSEPTISHAPTLPTIPPQGRIHAEPHPVSVQPPAHTVSPPPQSKPPSEQPKPASAPIHPANTSAQPANTSQSLRREANNQLSGRHEAAKHEEKSNGSEKKKNEDPQKR